MHSEIKDSCDFVQIPEFGFCIGKTFAQMLKIIKWFLRTWLRNSKKYQQIKVKLDNQKQKNSDQNKEELNVCAFCEELLKTNPYNRDAKRKGVAVSNGYDFRVAKRNHQDERNHFMEFQEQILEKYTLKEISSKRYIGDLSDMDILNRKYATMKLQFSNGGNVLEQVLNQFNMKTEAIARFVNNTKILDLQDYKSKSDITFQNFEKEMKLKIEQKFEEARQKLKIIVANKFEAYEKDKRNKMISIETQTGVGLDNIQRQKQQQKIKQLVQNVKKLQNQLQYEQSLNESLKQLIESKSIQFEEEFLKYRKEVIQNYQHKDSKTMLKSLKSLKEFFEGENEEGKENSILLAEPPSNERMAATIRMGGLMKKDSRKKMKNSIRFTIQNQSEEEEEDLYGSAKSNTFEDPFFEKPLIITENASTQTDQKESKMVLSGSSKKFILLQKEDTNRPRSRRQSKKKTACQEQNLKKTHNKIYSHVKSRVFNRMETTIIKKDISTANYNKDLVNKLTCNNFYVQQTGSSQEIQTFSITSEPIFTLITVLPFTTEDVFNLYLHSKNAQNYQCLIFRNTIFNDSNLNPKRSVHYSHKLYASDLDWNFKRDFQLSDETQEKLISCLFHQLTNLKKKEKNSYQNIKLILRFPAQIGSDIQLLSTSPSQGQKSKDIDISELRKMINIILKFHHGCTNNEKGQLCSHLVKFCEKVGIKIV